MTPILHMYPYYNPWECNWLFPDSMWQVVSSPVNWMKPKPQN